MPNQNGGGQGTDGQDGTPGGQQIQDALQEECDDLYKRIEALEIEKAMLEMVQ